MRKLLVKSLSGWRTPNAVQWKNKRYVFSEPQWVEQEFFRSLSKTMMNLEVIDIERDEPAPAPAPAPVAVKEDVKEEDTTKKRGNPNWLKRKDK